MEHKVSNLSEFIQVIEKIKVDSNMNYYFRGEGGVFLTTILGLYRSNMESEDKNNINLVINNIYPDYYDSLFNELGFSTFNDNSSQLEHFSEMQHYGAVTGMLDVTVNPLVALFFACENEDDSQDGVIKIYCSSKGSEKYSTGHTAAIKIATHFIDRYTLHAFLSTVKFLKTHIGHQLGYLEIFMREATVDSIYHDLKKFFIKILEFIDGQEEKDLNFHMNALYAYISIRTTEFRKQVLARKMIRLDDLKSGECLDKIIEKRKKDDAEENLIKSFQEKAIKDKYEEFISVVTDFLKDIMEELNQKALTRERLIHPIAVYDDLTSVHIIIPTKKNQRIVNQNGHFILPAYEFCRGSDWNQPEVIQRYVSESISKLELKDDCDKPITIKIPANKKKELILQLMNFGIDESFIYPDIQHISRVVMRKIKSIRN